MPMTFKEKIYASVGLIPPGRVATYGQVAQMAGYPATAARAVGNAIHTNNDPTKVPCHRVVTAGGSLGSNYGMGGTEAQRARLEAEGVRVDDGLKVDLERYGIVMEDHPLTPFLPQNGRILFLGSFPPPRAKWSMDFFYPNWINDFWRIQGLIHFGDAGWFEVKGEKRFDCERVKCFCVDKGLAFFDTANKVCRLKGNASDEFLEILQPSDIAGMVRQLPCCTAIATTGGKASGELADMLGETVLKVGQFQPVSIAGRTLTWWRMPSSSRAYPMSLTAKAEYYRKVFASLQHPSACPSAGSETRPSVL